MDYDIVVIGAGVVGLSVARELSSFTNNLCLIEKNSSHGLETSSRNSEVIHSGLYYPKNSLKSKLSIKGNELLYRYSQEKKIQYKRCGKLIIAVDDNELSSLKRLKKNANLVGVESSFINKDIIHKLEPLVNAKYALRIKSTGIIDSHSFMNSLISDIHKKNVDIAFKTKVNDIFKIENGYSIQIINPDKSHSNISTKILINCAGLHATFISSLIGLSSAKYQTHFWKGSYFWLKNKLMKSVNHLIYPIPSSQLDGLGIHTTKSIDGRVRIGPDSEYLGTFIPSDYSVDEKKKNIFYSHVKKYLPFLELDDLEIDFSGIRPKLQIPGDELKDFIIQNEVKNGYKNFINLIGIESPGLTSSLAIAKYVRKLII